MVDPQSGMLKNAASKAAMVYHLLRGGWDGPNCAHRTSTVSSCAFCEQGGHLATPSSPFGGRALREQRDRPSYPALFFSTLLRCELQDP